VAEARPVKPSLITGNDMQCAKHYLFAHYTVSQKKQDTKLLAITSLTIIRFSNFFTSGLSSKFATNPCLNIPPRLKHVATLPCEI